MVSKEKEAINPSTFFYEKDFFYVGCFFTELS